MSAKRPAHDEQWRLTSGPRRPNANVRRRAANVRRRAANVRRRAANVRRRAAKVCRRAAKVCCGAAKVRLGVAAGAAAVVAAAAVVLLTLPSPQRQPSPAAPTTPAAPPAATAPPPTPATTTEAFGASVNRLFNDRSYTPAQINAQLRALRATGATIARSDALWEAAEPTAPTGRQHRYDWVFDDQVAGALAAHDLRWLAILDYSAPWTESLPGRNHSPPKDPSDFAAYASAFAARYGSGGSFWATHPSLTPEPIDAYEIWNEPDNREFWLPVPDPVRYAELYLRARDAIVAVDPSARVIVGGLTHPETSLPAMLRARPELVGRIDGVGIHPYGANPRAVLARVRTARRVLDSLGLANVPIYVTEIGWTTDPPGSLSFVSERLRPSYIQTLISDLGHSGCGIAAVLVYTWVTPEHNPQDHEDWFGISPPGGGTSADVEAFAAGLRQAAVPATAAPTCG